MAVSKRQFGAVRVRKGSALVMVIVLTVLLSLIGALFIMMSRIDEMSTSSIKADAELKAGVDAVVDRINRLLVADIFADGSSFVWLDGSDTNEAWDYPKHTLGPGSDGLYDTDDDVAYSVGPDGIAETSDDIKMFDVDDDTWLASLEPEMVDMAVDAGGAEDMEIGFRHITTLYGTVARMFQRGDLDAEDERVSMRNLKATIIDPADSIEIGHKADADGDGVADSRWVKIPNIFSEDGKPMYAAVRIIDNGGMININTAYRDPTNLTVPGDWDGTQLSHINLEGIMADGDITAGKDARYIQYARPGYDIANTEPSIVFPSVFNDYINDIDYEFDVSRRILSPLRSSWNYLPFDIGDELELRNRFFLTSPTVNRFGHKATDGTDYIWQKTFDPGTGQTGVKIPYTSSANLPNWFDKATADSATGTCNRRHLSTTYNFERIARPEGRVTKYSSSMNTVTPLSESRKFGVTLPLDIQEGQASSVVKENYIRRLAMALYRGLPDDAAIDARFGSVYTREELAWQMAVNMVDYQDDKLDFSGETPVDAEEEVTKITIGNETYFGIEDLASLKRDTICISKLGYASAIEGSSLPGSPPSGEYLIFEVFNPDDNSDKLLADMLDYEIRITDSSGVDKFKAGPLSGTLNKSVAGASGTTGLFAVSNTSATQPRIGTLFSATALPVLLSANPFWSPLAVGDKVMVIKISTGMPVDCVSIPPSLIPAGSDFAVKRYRRTVFSGTNFLLPAWSSASGEQPWEDPGVGGIWQLGNSIDSADLEDPTDSASPVYDPDLAGLEKVQLDVPNEQLRNVGEIENVFAIGANYYENGSTHICRTLWQGVMDSVMAIKNDGGDLTADQDDGIEMGSFGRIRLDDPDYWPMLDSLTYFDPTRDGVDLINIAEGKTAVNVGTLAGGSEAFLDTLTDGLFLPRQTGWNSGTVYWNDTTVEIEIDFGGTEEIFGAIIQADDNDEYLLEYYDGTWHPLWWLENYGWLGDGGMHTRPDMEDDARWQLFDMPALASKVRVTATGGDDKYSLSEIQIGIKYDPAADDPYYYGNTVAGRININTAPWYVINQLPWIEDVSAAELGSLAQAIVAFRDKNIIGDGPTGPVYGPDYQVRNVGTGIPATDIDEDRGFKDVGQLLQVINTVTSEPDMVDYDIRKNIFDGAPALDVDGDYTPDNSTDDFEERNLLFHRISNLVSVRSDVFTAYILVRIGENGPQRRMIAIFDRNSIESSGDKPKLVALHRVPDPR